MKFIIFDTETTGLKPGQIGQLTYAILDMETRRAKSKNFYFAVDSMEASAEQVHGLSKEKLMELSKGEVFADRAEEILQDFSGKVWVGHNVNFDIKFLEAELERNRMYFEHTTTYCTMKNFTNIAKIPGKNGKYKFPKLEELVRFMNITEKEIEEFAVKLFGGFSGYHDARYDVAATALIFIKGHQAGYIELKQDIA